MKADAARWSRPCDALTDQPARLTDRLRTLSEPFVNRLWPWGLSMGDLTRQDVEDAVRGVLNSKEFAAQLQIFVSETADNRISTKMLLTFGIDCSEPEEINKTRRDMDFLRNTREWSEGELSKFLRASFWLVIAGSVTYGAFREFIKGLLK